MNVNAQRIIYSAKCIGMRDPVAERLKIARKAAGFANAREGAESLGVEYPTYAAHENGSRKFDLETAGRYARRFRVSLDWLVNAKGDGPAVESIVPLMGYVGAGAEVDPEFDQVPPEGLDQISVPFPLPDEMIAFKVRGISMLPVFRDGTVIIVYREQKRNLESFFGEEAAVRTAQGKRYIKTVMRGSRSGLVTLTSWNAEPIEDQHLEWIGEIFAVLPNSALRRVGNQGGVQGSLKLRAG